MRAAGGTHLQGGFIALAQKATRNSRNLGRICDTKAFPGLGLAVTPPAANERGWRMAACIIYLGGNRGGGPPTTNE